MRVSIASDYAVLDCDEKGYFYFGYEVETHTESCFQFTLGKKVIATFPQSELGIDDGMEMGEYLLAGMGKLVERGILKT